MRKFSRLSAHRLSLLKNLVKSLVEHGKICTLISRAKDLRMVIEPLLTRAKECNLHNRRILLSKLWNDEKTVDKMFEVGQLNKERAGGYIRILRCGFRPDGSTKAIIEIIDYPKKEDSENKTEEFLDDEDSGRKISVSA